MSAPDSAAASDPMRCGYSDTADNRSSEGTTSVLIEIHPTVVNDNYLSATRNHSSRHTMSLSANQATALLLADCLGTGLLALPNDIRVLGSLVGLGFLILNLPINYFAGYILHETAMAVEQQQNEAETHRALLSFSSINGMLQQYNYQTIRSHPDTKISPISNPSNKFSVGSTSISTQPSPIVNQNNKNNDTATFDFIGMTTALFTDNPSATFTVTCMYYCNIFLVLGNYILVMSYAVVAAFGETNVDILTAGGLSAMGMFAVSQTRTMARLGRSASFVSLTALLVVILQCLWEVRQEQRRFPIVPPAILSTEPTSVPNSESPFMQQLRKLSALGSIGFAVGSQKLFLNIRHELADRNDAPRTLAGGLTAFGTLYVLSCLVAGPHPPSFLFDAIPTSSWNRHFAGALLWIHVVVSYGM